MNVEANAPAILEEIADDLMYISIFNGHPVGTTKKQCYEAIQKIKDVIYRNGVKGREGEGCWKVFFGQNEDGSELIRMTCGRCKSEFEYKGPTARLNARIMNFCPICGMRATYRIKEGGFLDEQSRTQSSCTP